MSKKNKKPTKKSATTAKATNGSRASGRTYEILKVYWEDHFSGNHAWGSEDDLRVKPMVCISVGMKVNENKKTITLAQNMGESRNIADTITIMKSCVVGKDKLGTIEYASD